jgi:hypothetical protein
MGEGPHGLPRLLQEAAKSAYETVVLAGKTKEACEVVAKRARGRETPGVSYDKRLSKWVVRVHARGAKRRLGVFQTEEEAVRVCQEARKEESTVEALLELAVA